MAPIPIGEVSAVTLTFDDSAGTAISSLSDPMTGTYTPEQPLSAFNGETGVGTWTLTLAEVAAAGFLIYESSSLTINELVPVELLSFSAQ